MMHLRLLVPSCGMRLRHAVEHIGRLHHLHWRRRARRPSQQLLAALLRQRAGSAAFQAHAIFDGIALDAVMTGERPALRAGKDVGNTLADN